MVLQQRLQTGALKQSAWQNAIQGTIYSALESARGKHTTRTYTPKTIYFLQPQCLELLLEVNIISRPKDGSSALQTVFTTLKFRGDALTLTGWSPFILHAYRMLSRHPSRLNLKKKVSFKNTELNSVLFCYGETTSDHPVENKEKHPSKTKRERKGFDGGFLILSTLSPYSFHYYFKSYEHSHDVYST
jgi:hypothetical protein